MSLCENPKNARIEGTLVNVLSINLRIHLLS